MSLLANQSPVTTADKPPRPRRWIPLSLRMFVAILVLLGVGSTLLTWVSYRREQQMYRREQQVIREIKSWGGYVGTVAGGSAWLRQLAGKDSLIDVTAFERISFILVDGKALTDAGLARFQLSTLTNLDGVSFDQTAVTDA